MEPLQSRRLAGRFIGTVKFLCPFSCLASVDAHFLASVFAFSTHDGVRAFYTFRRVLSYVIFA